MAQTANPVPTTVSLDLSTLDTGSRLLVLAMSGQIDAVVSEFATWRNEYEKAETVFKTARAAYVATRNMVVAGKPELAEKIHNPFEGRGRKPGSTTETTEDSDTDSE